MIASVHPADTQMRARHASEVRVQSNFSSHRKDAMAADLVFACQELLCALQQSAHPPPI